MQRLLFAVALVLCSGLVLAACGDDCKDVGATCAKSADCCSNNCIKNNSGAGPDNYCVPRE